MSLRKQNRIISIVCGVALGGYLGLLFAQEAKKDPPKYTPSPEHMKSLQYKQHIAVYAQQALQAEMQKLPQWADAQKAGADLMEACKTVSKEEKWPDDVTCDPNTLTFAAPVKAPEKKP